MPNYRGSNLSQVVPEHRVKTYPDITDEQVQAWWNAFSTGAGSDESIGAKYDEGKNLYLLADDGSIVRALQEGDSLTNQSVLRRLMENSLNGRLFTLNMEEALPRQVVTETNAPYEVGVSHAYNRWLLETPDVPEEPPRHPGYLKYLLWPFSSAVREEFRTYKTEKAEYDRLQAHETWLNNAFQNGSDILEGDKNYEIKRRRDAQEKQKQAEQDAIDKAAFRKQQNERKQEWEKDVSQMSPKDFDGYTSKLFREVNAILREEGKELLCEIIQNKYSTVDDLYDALTRAMEGRMERAMNPVRETFRDQQLHHEYLALVQKPYQEAKAGLKDYVREKFDPSLVEKALNSHNRYSEATYALCEKFEEVQKNISSDPYFTDKGLLFNAKNIPAKMFQDAMALKHKEVGAVGMQKLANDINNQIKAQAKPDQAVQQPNQVQQQMQQPQPQPQQPAGLGMGGPG